MGKILAEGDITKAGTRTDRAEEQTQAGGLEAKRSKAMKMVVFFYIFIRVFCFDSFLAL